MNSSPRRRIANLVILTILSITLIVPSAPVSAREATPDSAPVEAPAARDNKDMGVERAQKAATVETGSAEVPALKSISSVAAQEEVGANDNKPHPGAAQQTAGKQSEYRALVSSDSAAKVIAPSPPLTSQPSPMIPSDLLLVSSFRISDGLVDFVELYNTEDDQLVSLDGVSLVLHYQFESDTNGDGVIDERSIVPCTTMKLAEYIVPEHYVALVRAPMVVEYAHQFASCQSPMADNPTKLLLEIRRSSQRNPITNPDGVVERLEIPNPGEAQRWDRKGFTSSYRDGVLSEDFKKTEARGHHVYSDPLYTPPPAPHLEIVEILPSPRSCSIDNPSLVCKPYVKVINTSTQAIDLSAYRLRGGERTDRASSSNTTRLSGQIAADSFAIIHQSSDEEMLSIDSREGTVWFEDAYGVKTYENSVTPYEKANTAAYEGRAWAYDNNDETWKWGQPSPSKRQTDFIKPGLGGVGKSQSFDGLKPCTVGQYRNPATSRCKKIGTTAGSLKPCGPGEYRNPSTNRCKKLASTTSSLKPCGSGEYRNPATNRCKKLASTTSSLKPCGPGEYRNPATNRCKKLASSTSTLKPCKPGYERNPETNRCRKVAVAGVSVPAVDFPVQEVKDGTKAFVGWWALGGLLILGAGYAAFEWRHEIASATRSLGATLSSKGK